MDKSEHEKIPKCSKRVAVDTAGYFENYRIFYQKEKKDVVAILDTLMWETSFFTVN